MDYKQILEDLELRKTRKESGLFNSLLSPFSSLGNKFPGLERGLYYLFTANSGIGKTKFSKYFFILSSYKFCKQNNIPIHIKYFALEETESDFWLSIAITLLKDLKIYVDVQQVKSAGEKTLTKEVLEGLKKIQPLIDEMMESIEVIDHIFNPYGIYKHVQEWADTKVGKLVVDNNFKTTYKLNNPEQYTIIVTDHISLLQPEKDRETGEIMTLHKTMSKFSQNYCLKGFCKRYNFIVVNIQQQEAAKEKLQFSFGGESIEQKLEPSLDGCADNKLCTREADIVLGLFAPVRYEIQEYRGYDITQLRDGYRALKFLKDRHYGLANTYVHLFMDGARNTFGELPNPKNMSKEYYSQLVTKYNL